MPQQPQSIARYGAGVPTPPPKAKTPTWVVIAATVLVVCCVVPMALGLIGRIFDGDKATTAGQPTGSTPPPTTAAPQQLSASEQLTKAITEKLGPTNRDGLPKPTVASWPDEPSKTIDVQWALNDNLTEGLIRVGARGDVLDIIRVVKAKATWPYVSLRLKATFSMIDKYGNASESVVLDLTYSRATVDKINPDGIQLDQVFAAADDGFVHPEFR